jgi:hypothetical protein
MKHLVDNEPAKRRPKNEASTHGASLHGKETKLYLNRLPCEYWSTGGRHPYKARELLCPRAAIPGKARLPGLQKSMFFKALMPSSTLLIGCAPPDGGKLTG